MNHNLTIKFISWNVRGLNERNKRLAVRQTFLLEKPDLVCLQETKLETLDIKAIRETCGSRLKEYKSLIDDLRDLAVIAERKNESSEPLNVVRERLQNKWNTGSK